MKCTRCKSKAIVALPSHNAGFCKQCFLKYFENQVQKAIKSKAMFTQDDKILIAISGGKDSLALALQLKSLGYNITGLHVDLDIPNSSEHVREIVKKFCQTFSIPLFIISLKKENLSIPKVKQTLSRPICSACGQIKRYYFNRFALEHGFHVLATGHNLDDEVARLFANTLRWDETYLGSQGPVLKEENGFAKKVKPLYRLTEFETAVFCFLHNINYNTKPCPYSKRASFTFYKKLLDDLEYQQPGRKFNFYETFLKKGKRGFQLLRKSKLTLNSCQKCNYPTTETICGVCRIKKIISSNN